MNPTRQQLIDNISNEILDNVSNNSTPLSDEELIIATNAAYDHLTTVNPNLPTRPQ